MTPLNNAAAQPGDDEAGDAADAMPAISAAATVTVSVTITDAVEQHDIGEALVDIADALASALENSASADAAGELFAAALAELADRRGSGTLRHAAHVLRGRKGGRPRLDV